jgi:hypothetical protein
LEDYDKAIEAFDNYLKATRWHSDVLPWRIPLAEKKLEELAQVKQAQLDRQPRLPARARGR